MPEERRRIGDSPDLRAAIFDMKGLMERTHQRLEDHIRWSEDMSKKRDQQFEKIEDRVKDVEEFNGNIKLAVKAAGVIGAPTGAGIGYVIWEKFKHVIGIHGG